MPEYKNEGGDIIITIDHEKCTAAAVCIDVCPADVFELKEGKAIAPRVDDCVECCACVQNCPEIAIKHNSC